MFVLVVDDNEDFLLLCRRALEARGHEVETTSAAFGLVNKVAGSHGPRPDAVVLDCDLPGLTGFAAIELLSKDRRTSQTPVLLVSADYSANHLEAARLHPRAVFMQKDGHLRELVEKLEEHAAETASAAVVSTVKP